MLIAHAPAGYIVSRLLAPRFEARGASYRAFVCWGMLGAVAPDLDLLWYLLVDHRQHNHHDYLTHWPIVWLLAMALSLAWMRRRPAAGALTFSFSLGGFSHMILDTVVGGICWFAPFSDQRYVIANPTPDFLALWWFYFLFHWSFKLELGITLAAFVYWLKPRRPRSDKAVHARRP